MNHQVRFLSGSDLPPWFPPDAVPESEAPVGRIAVLVSEIVVAHAALWWSQTPALEGEAVGTIGGFSAVDETASTILLEAALRQLADAGCSIAVGPMNGNTWREYRFVDESDGRNPFLLEPENSPDYPAWWRAAGFEDLSHYSSSVMPLDGSDAVSPALRERIFRSGISIRPIDPARYDDELRIIHGLSLRAFSSNFLYTPLDEHSFIGSYRKVQAHVDPGFVLIAEKEGKAVGFVFGIADLEAARRGEKPALIVKTLAVDPASRSAGLGSLLVDELHRAARAKGFTEAIHALQHEDNTSLKITGRHAGRAFRKYVLFSKRP